MSDKSNSLGIFTEKIAQLMCPGCESKLDVSEFEVFEDIACPVCQEPIKVPGRLGDFILIEELGRGAMGCVYLARDESLNRLVALKVIRKEYGEDPKMLENVQREAQAMATLNHRNVVQVYSFGRMREQPYFVMELLEGERLDEMMAGGRRMPEIRALEIAIDVAQGLEAAKNAGLTHGDIKPANILMNNKGVAKVVDFGLAKFMEPGAEIEVWGTPYYIAPEKAKKKGEDSRSDQYSLGGTLFHALAGQPPFDGETPTKVVVAALKQDTPSLSDFNEGVTGKTVQVIRRMMEKNPNRRYPTYSSLLADLELALAAAREAEEQRKAEARRQLEKQQKKTSPIVAIMLGVSLIMLGGIGFLAWKQSQGGGRVTRPEYEGPRRSPDKPFTRSEERNLANAVEALNKNDLMEAEERLKVVYRYIPEQHAAMGWAKFHEAGMRLYAQYPEEMKRLLEEVAGMEDMIFDTKKAPPEDPRTLARYALGELEEKDLQKAVRKGQTHFAHLAELARGYRRMLEEDRNASARHFRAYGQLRTNLAWPYVLAPLAPQLHLPLEKLDANQTREQRAAEQLLSDLGVKDSQGRPLFRRTPLTPQGTVDINLSRNPTWKQSDPGGGWVSEIRKGDEVFTNAKGLMPFPGRDFTIVLEGGLTDPGGQEPERKVFLAHFAERRTPEQRNETPSGLLFEVLIRPDGGVMLQVWAKKEGKGTMIYSHPLKEGSLSGEKLKVRLDWDGEAMSVWLNEQPPVRLPVSPEKLAPEGDLDALVLGGRLARNRRIARRGGFEIERILVFDRLKNPDKIE